MQLALCESKQSGRHICAYPLPNVDYGQASLKTCWPRPQCQEGLTGCELRLQLLTAEGRCPRQTGSEKLPIFGSWWQPSVRQGCGRIAQVLPVTLGGLPESEDTTALWANCPSCHTRSSIAGYHSGLGGRHVDSSLTVPPPLHFSIRSERNPEQALGPRANLCKICRGRKYA